MSRKISWGDLLGAAGNVANILTLLAFTVVSWGALQPIVGGVTQWLTTVVGTHFAPIALSRALQLGISVFVGLLMMLLVRKELFDMRRDIDLNTIKNQTYTQTVMGHVMGTVADRGMDVRRLYVENYLQRILLMGFAARADKATVRNAISSRRGVVQQQLTDEDDKAMALGMIELYERTIDDSYPDG